MEEVHNYALRINISGAVTVYGPSLEEKCSNLSSLYLGAKFVTSLTRLLFAEMVRRQSISWQDESVLKHIDRSNL